MHRISLLFNQPTTNHKSASIEAIMTMYTYFCIFISFCAGSGQTLLHNGDKALDIFFGWRDFSCGWIFVVCNMGIMERSGIVGCMDTMRYIDNMSNLRILAD